ncbi:MAG: response regulator, partial [Chloroflexota bacterium]
SNPKLKDIPVVAVSSADATAEMNKARRLGFRGFISKPIDVALFPKQVRQVIDGLDVWYAR